MLDKVIGEVSFRHVGHRLLQQHFKNYILQCFCFITQPAAYWAAIKASLITNQARVCAACLNFELGGS